MKTARAFTLVELIVVIAIIAILMSGSIVGLLSFKESSYLKSNVEEFVSQARTDLSYARNSVYSQSELEVLTNDPTCSTISISEFAPDATGYYFNPSTKSAEFIKCVSTDLSVENNYCCVLAPEAYSQKLDNEKIEYSSDCDGVLFEYSTGRVLRFNPSASRGVDISAGGSTSIKAVEENCELKINHTGIGFSKTILFDSEGSTIGIE